MLILKNLQVYKRDCAYLSRKWQNAVYVECTPFQSNAKIHARGSNLIFDPSNHELVQLPLLLPTAFLDAFKHCSKLCTILKSVRVLEQKIQRP